MDNLEFISKIIESVAWPLSTLVLIAILRKPIRDLIPLISKLKYKDIEMQFDKNLYRLSEKVNYELPKVQNEKETEELRDRVMKIIQISPKSSIIEVWRAVESSIIENVTNNKLEVDSRFLKYPIKLAETLLKNHLISESQYEIIEDMRKLRNEVVHYDKKEVSKNNAMEYLQSGIKLILSMKKDEKNS